MTAPRGPDCSTAVLPYGGDPLAWLAQRLGERIAASGPDLNRVVVLLPDLQHAPRLRRLLQDQAQGHGCSAVLGPRIHTLCGFIQASAIDTGAVLAPDARELLLVRALRGHRSLFGAADPWRLADGLLELFAELTRQQVALPGRCPEFAALLQRAYGIDAHVPEHLGREAAMVHTLWQAWHRELEALGYVDPEHAFALRLERSLAVLPPELHLFVVGFTDATPAQAAWIRALRARGQVTVVLHGDPAGDESGPHAALGRVAAQLGLDEAPRPAHDPFSAFLETAFDPQTAPLALRARRFAAAQPASPLAGRLALFCAEDSEHEAGAVELQVRRWLLDGAASVGIVTEDRRLARRIRALLERAGITLQDSGGWALSTTSAATAIERWLQAVEEDFAHRPLLDLLKSPFLLPQDPDGAAEFRQAVYRFERDLVRHENITRGLARYRAHLRYRGSRLPWPARGRTAVDALLGRLQQAAAPILGLLRGAHPVERYLEAVQRSLQRLGLTPGLAADAAGARVLERLERLQEAARRHSLECSWAEFRAWLGATLERSHFRPATAGAAVQLLSLEQSRLARFDALVIAGAERGLLPGSPTTSPYFNDAVRRELGLPTWRHALDLRWNHFRRLLEAAPRVLLSRRSEQDGEAILPCPWVQALETFHRAAYGRSLEEGDLRALLVDPQCQVQAADPGQAPTLSQRPRPRLPAVRLPDSLSAAGHQRLIDCPYQFFSADGLRLRPLDEVREALEKSDYGERVHRCLQAFHGGLEGLPGPFTGTLDSARRTTAIALLEDIARAVFAQDLEDNFLHRGWLHRWRQRIPGYVDWEIRRQQRWHPLQAEQARERVLAGGHRLRGRLDRLDVDAAGGQAILDYKTGRTPSDEEVLAGEAVQLITYALLEPAEQVEYLRIDSTPVKAVGVTDPEILAQLCADVGARLERVLDAIAAAAPLPAWGDAQTCARCVMPGVCRRDAWSGEQSGD